MMMKGIALTYTLLSVKLPEEDLIRLGGSRPQISNEEVDKSEVGVDFREYMSAFGSIGLQKRLGLVDSDPVKTGDKPKDDPLDTDGKDPIATDARYANAKKFLTTCLAVGTLAFVIKMVHANRVSISASIGNWRAEWIDPYLGKGKATEAL